ncbi:MAG: hypothetical protein GC193_03785 [Cryomorphaceae bacterium]|nr:hypothetical protein [Cryomorphaceae bacterium]
MKPTDNLFKACALALCFFFLLQASATSETNVVSTSNMLPPIGFVASSPAANATSVPIDADIVLTFSGPTDISLVNNTNIRIMSNVYGRVNGTFTGGGTNEITFNPTNNFKVGDKISVAVSSDLTQTEGINFSFNCAVSEESAGGFFENRDHISGAVVLIWSGFLADFSGNGLFDAMIGIGGTPGLRLFENVNDPNYKEYSLFGEYNYTTIGFFAGTVPNIVPGDIDNDGDVDIVVSVFDAGKVYWVPNLGDGEFGTEILIADNVTYCTHVITADVNGDGSLDVIATKFGVAEMVWCANDGLGNFGPKNIISTSATSIFSLHSADIDNDGDMDLFSTNNGSSSSISLYRNDGLGNFGLPELVTNEVISPRDVETADLDGDGDLDLISASVGDNKFAWYENDGTGTFGVQNVLSSTAIGANALVIFDADGDGDLDIVGSSETDKQVVWFTNNGEGGFSAENYITTTPSQVKQLQALDMNGDNDLDIVTIGPGSLSWIRNAFPVSIVDVSIEANATSVPVDENIVFTFDNLVVDEFIDVKSMSLIGDKSGYFPGTLTGFGTNQLVFNPSRDFKRGEIITLTTHNLLATPQKRVFSFTAATGSDGPLTFSYPKTINTYYFNPVDFVLGDFGSSNHLDIFVGSVDTMAMNIWRNNGNGTFAINGFYSNYQRYHRTYGIHTADFNLDGKLDLSLASWFLSPNNQTGGTTPNTYQILYSKNNTTGSYLSMPFQRITQVIEPDEQPTEVFNGDINGDGEEDIVGINEDYVFWNEYQSDDLDYNVNWPFADAETVNSNSFAKKVYLADLDNDGDLDAIVGFNGSIQWSANNGNGDFGAPINITTSINGTQSIFAADLDNDGDLDLLSASKSDHKIAWYENLGVGTFGSQQILTNATLGTVDVQAADMDGDGDMDVIFSSELDNTIGWFANNGDASFGPQLTISTICTAVTGIRLGDMDNDGDLDVVYISYNDHKLAWLENRELLVLDNISTETSYTEITIESSIAINFNEDPDPALLNEDNIVVYGEQSGQIDYEIAGLGNANIELTLLTGLKPGERVSVLVKDQVGINHSVHSVLTVGVDPLSPGKFDNGATIITSSSDGPRCLFSADMDGDGDLDVLTVSQSEASVSIYFNDGTGSLSSPQMVNTGILSPQHVRACDLDGDTDLDIVVCSAQNNILAWCENLGESAFGSAQTISTAFQAINNFVNADLDGDGDQDIITASINDNTVAWFENDGQGVFGPRLIISTMGLGARTVCAADIDGDGDLDVLAGSSVDDEIAWYPNDGNGNFGAQQIISTEADFVTSIYPADLNGDGFTDIVSSSSDDNKVAWYANDGQGNFGAQQIITTEAIGARSVYVADLNGDEMPDVISASFGDGKVAFYLNNGVGGFGEQNVLTTAVGAATLFAADLDGDNDLDILSGSFWTDTFQWFENVINVYIVSSYPTANSHDAVLNSNIVLTLNQALSSETIDPTSILVHGSQSGYIEGTLSIAGIEVTFDPLSDFKPGEEVTVTITKEFGINQPYIFSFRVGVSINSPGVFMETENIVSTSDGGAYEIISTDIDGDGDLDIVSANFFGNDIKWHSNDGTGQFTSNAIVTSTAGNANDVLAADLDKDGDMDLISTSQLDNKLAWYQNDGVGNFGPQIIIGTLNGAEGVFAADLNGDGELDLVSCSKTGNLIVWFENLGEGSFSTQAIISSQVNTPRDVLAADFDNDGDLDVISASSNDDKIAWYENNGFGSFGAQQVISTQENGAFRLEVADLDGDGDTDVISLAQLDGIVSWFANDGTGAFGPRQIIQDNTLQVKGIAVGDLNGNGYLDLILRFAQSGGGEQLLWFDNDGAGNFTEQQIEVTTTYSNSWGVNTADLDGDGDLDILSTSSNIDEISWYENTVGPDLPIAVCQDITVGLSSSNSVTIAASELDGGSTAEGGVSSITVDIDTFDATNIGENAVVLTVTDNLGNVAQCTATVTVISCLGDLNGDFVVNSADLIFFISDFGCSSNCTVDLTGDDVVNSADFILFLSQYGQSCN